jgi:hypothetical protein
MFPLAIHLAVILNHRVDPLTLESEIEEQVEQMQADIAPEEGILNVGAPARAKHVLDGPADIRGGVHQRAIHVEQVNRKRGDHKVGRPVLPAANRLSITPVAVRLRAFRERGVPRPA